jgi:thioredoxin 1
MADVKHVNDSTFDGEVLKAAGLVLVDFWAPWCGPCRMLAPVIDSLAAKYEGKIKVCKVNTDESPATPGKYDIHGIPTLILFNGGQEVKRHVGYAAESQLAEMIDGILK